MKGRAWLPLLAFALIAAAIASFRPASTPGPFLRDFEAYWSAGSAWNANASPYGRSIWKDERRIPGVDASHDELLPFVGPPATLLVWSGFARLPYVDAARLWFALLALALLALAATVAAASAVRLSAFAFFSAVALAIAFGPATSDVALGQMALIALLGATIATQPLGTLTRAAGACVALFQPNVAFGLVSQLGRNRTTLALAIAAGVTYAAGAASLGWSWPARYAALLLSHARAERVSAIQLTPGAIAYGAGLPGGVAAFVAVATAIVALAIAALIWRRVSDPFARFAAVATLAPFVSTFFHEHDLIVGYVAAGWCAMRAGGRIRAAALGATLLVAIDWLGLAQRPTGIVQSVLLAVAAACAFVALGETFDWRTGSVTGGAIAALFVFAAWLAVTHPAPIWPDALGHFHAPAAAGAAELWRQEQERTGLFAINPVWAFLRCLSLAGCALLSLCVYVESRVRN